MAALQIVLGFIAAMVLLGFIASIFSPDTRGEISPADRAQHATDGDGHIYYWNDGQLVHECDGCADCAESRLADLQRQGYQIDEYIPGRRHSGELEW